MEKARGVDLLAPAGGVLMLVSAFMNWFRYPDPDVVRLQKQFEVPARNIEDSATLITATAWEITSLRYILYLTAIAAIVQFFLLISSRTPGRAVVFSTPLFLLGTLTTGWILIRWAVPPFDDAEAMRGLLAGLAGSLLLTCGTFLALRDERIPDGFDQAPPAQAVSLPDAAATPAEQQPAPAPAQQPPTPQAPAAGERSDSIAPPQRPPA